MVCAMTRQVSHEKGAAAYAGWLAVKLTKTAPNEAGRAPATSFGSKPGYGHAEPEHAFAAKSA